MDSRTVAVFSGKKTKISDELAKGLGCSIIALVEALIEEAHVMRASDIHIDPREKTVRVRFRVDGALQDVVALPKDIQSEVVTRIKVLAGLRTDEHAAAQDGRFRILIANQQIDIRVSIIPTYYGEKTVLRLLTEHGEKFTLDTLGFSPSDAAKVIRAIRNPYGMILITGPTGSGKTTSLYTLLKMLYTDEVSIITIEDPIEYSIEGINQIQVNHRSGLSFANGLRSVLRQDPDIIMVGEIRDAETAGLAVNTGLTGHLVLSTLHTNDAPTSFPRLIDLGIEPYLITATINIVIGQRLVRKICACCKTEKILSHEEVKSLGEFPGFAALLRKKETWKGAGCGECNGSGYRGRIGIYEVLAVDDTIRNTLLARGTASDVRKAATALGMTAMFEDGCKKIIDGITTIEEVLRVIHE